VLDLVRREGLEVEWVLDTHPHADHLMASAYLRDKTGAPAAIGEKVREIAELWRKIYNTPDTFDPERDFDRLFKDGERFRIGELEAEVMLSPGHTLGSITYRVGDAAFVHDTFMQPESGTSRCDFPGGSSAVLYDTLQRLLALPDGTRLFVGHDYCPEGRAPEWEATVARHKAENKHLAGGVSKKEFMRVRDERDAKLALPERILAALQFNLRGGRPPEPESDGASYLKIPLDKF
jgi:glyoxylase-like metal-dependent hydrolase (beta-lactamase superfamily II)